METKYSFTVKPTKLNVFIATNLSFLMRPARTIFIFLFATLLISFFIITSITFSISNLLELIILLSFIFIFSFVIFLILVEIEFVIVILSKKILTTQSEMTFTDNEMITKKKGLETKVSYSAIKSVKYFGKYLLIKINGFSSICFIHLNDSYKIREVYALLQNKLA